MKLNECKVISYFQYRTMMIEIRRAKEPHLFHNQILLKLPNSDMVKLSLFAMMARMQNCLEDEVLDEFMNLRERGFSISVIESSWEEAIENFLAEE